MLESLQIKQDGCSSDVMVLKYSGVMSCQETFWQTKSEWRAFVLGVIEVRSYFTLKSLSRMAVQLTGRIDRASLSCTTTILVMVICRL